jgi:hypothetical protein
MLGIEVTDDRVQVEPHLPRSCGHLELTGVPLRGRIFEISAVGTSGECRQAE